MTRVISKHVSVRLEVVLVTVQDRCTVLDAPMVLLGDEAQVEARFGLFGDSANVDSR